MKKELMENTIGDISVPTGFPYLEVLKKGPPVHQPNDDFSIRHPAMPLSGRAKIFLPFEALKRH